MEVSAELDAVALWVVVRNVEVIGEGTEGVEADSVLVGVVGEGELDDLIDDGVGGEVKGAAKDAARVENADVLENRYG